MPISREEFELGQIDPSWFVVQFLRDSFPEAFSLDELLEKLSSYGRRTTLGELAHLLQNHETAGRVKSQETSSGVLYYRYNRKQLGFLPR